MALVVMPAVMTRPTIQNTAAVATPTHQGELAEHIEDFFNQACARHG